MKNKIIEANFHDPNSLLLSKKQTCNANRGRLCAHKQARESGRLPAARGSWGGSAGSGAGGQGGALGARRPRSAPGSATRGLSGLGKLLGPSAPTGSSQRPPTTSWWAALEFVRSTEERSGHRREPLRTGLLCGHRTSSSPLKTKTNSALSAQPRPAGGHSDKATLPALPGWSLQVAAACGGRPPARAEGRAPRTCRVPCLGSALPPLTEVPHPAGFPQTRATGTKIRA